MRILSVIGARPQFIKAAAVSRQLAARGIEEVIVHTGQHFDSNMSQVFFDEMRIPEPKYNLGVAGLTHGAMTGRMIEGIEKVILGEKPDMVLVYGDTNSTLAGAIAARKQNYPVAHVEAGLRSFNMEMPEEVNRILTDRIATLLFCPTEMAVKNLKAEGFENYHCQIYKTGDVMYDTALYYGSISESKSKIIGQLKPRNPFVLATVHRQENTDDPTRLREIINALEAINLDRQVVVPLHPRTARFLNDMGIEPQLTVVPPVGYFDMVELLKHCSLVITDSGGVQKEAFFFRKSCITLRDETEWVELVEFGLNTLAKAEEGDIVSKYKKALSSKPDFSVDLYGNGNAAGQIAEILANWPNV